MNIPTWTCADFEAALTDYRDGVLRLDSAAAARQHLSGCPVCPELLAGVAEVMAQVRALPELEPPPRLRAAILTRTLPSPSARRPVLSGFRSGLGRLRAALVSPRFVLGFAMTVFAFSLLLNAAQINLRLVARDASFDQLSPANVAGVLQRKLVRTWARGVSYYHDLRVVYEIEAAVHQMREPPAPAQIQPTGHDHSQADPDHPDVSPAAALFSPPAGPLRRIS